MRRKRPEHPLNRTASAAEAGMRAPVLRTKLQRPPVAPDVFPRPRLLDRLNEGRRRTLTLISAPAGYGKSTLASRWVEACDSPCGWVSLDESDNDLRTFLSYVLAAIRLLFPGMELRTEAFLEAGQLPSVPGLARHLLNDLHQVTEPFILVLDDYHHIREGDVHDLVAELLAHPPQAMHLVLLTRHDPALPIARLRGRGQVTEIRAADLRFTPEEAAGFLGKMLKVPVDDATAALLEKKTEGWATGLRLAGLYLRGEGDLRRRVQELSGSSQHIAMYLASEVLSRQEPEIVALLVETSILERFCAPLCRAVHSKGVEEPGAQQGFDAQRFIEWLVEANIFVIPLDDRGYWFRYHHLFRDFLHARLRKQSDAETIAGLHVKASNWFAENGLIDEAIHHALAAGDIRAAVRLIVEHRYELMNTSQFIRLDRWLRLLPANAFAETPLLVSTRAVIGIEQGQDLDVYTSVDQADRMLARLSPEAAEYALLKGEVHLLKGFIDMAVGRPDSARAHAEEALGSLPAHAFSLRSLGIITLAVCYQMQGNPGQTHKVIREALRNTGWPENIRARIHFALSLALYMDADLVGAMAASRACLQDVRGLSYTHTRTFALYLMGAAHYWRNEFDQAEPLVLDVLGEYQAANPSYVVNAVFVLACIYLARDSAGQAEQVFERITPHFQEIGHPVALAMLQAFQAEFALLQGEINRARQLSKNVDFDIRPPIWFFYVPQLTPVKLRLAEGTDESLKEARIRLAEWDKRTDRINRKSVRIDVLALLALVCHKSGEETAALEKLRTALSLAEPGGWIRNFVDLGAPMRDLLERFTRVQPDHGYAQQILAACQAELRRMPSSGAVAEKGSRLSGQAPAPILTARETEILTLLAEGLGNKEIAAKLHIATETVKTHLKTIYGKLEAKGRIEAMNKARTSGLITRD